MKIEKISDNQIKCTINKEDLSVRGISITELAYGSESAKSLFNEIMSQAFSEFGFVSDETPIVIEAIPLSTGSLILLVSKENEPEELDTRFSKFSPESELSGSKLPQDSLNIGKDSSSGYSNLLDIEEIDTMDKEDFVPLPNLFKEETEPTGTIKSNHKQINSSKIKVYRFSSLSTICDLASRIGTNFKGRSSVYKNTERNLYFLVLEYQEADKESFSALSSFLNEYTTLLKSNYATLSYLSEHYEPIVKEDALMVLSAL